jgi:hypothetical protein
LRGAAAARYRVPPSEVTDQQARNFGDETLTQNLGIFAEEASRQQRAVDPRSEAARQAGNTGASALVQTGADMGIRMAVNRALSRVAASRVGQAVAGSAAGQAAGRAIGAGPLRSAVGGVANFLGVPAALEAVDQHVLPDSWRNNWFSNNVLGADPVRPPNQEVAIQRPVNELVRNQQQADAIARAATTRGERLDAGAANFAHTLMGGLNLMNRPIALARWTDETLRNNTAASQGEAQRQRGEIQNLANNISRSMTAAQTLTPGQQRDLAIWRQRLFALTRGDHRTQFELQQHGILPSGVHQAP